MAAEVAGGGQVAGLAEVGVEEAAANAGGQVDDRPGVETDVHTATVDLVAQQQRCFQQADVVAGPDVSRRLVDRQTVLHLVTDLGIGQTAAEDQAIVQLVGTPETNLVADLRRFAEVTQFAQRQVGRGAGGKLLVGVGNAEEEFGLEAVAGRAAEDTRLAVTADAGQVAEGGVVVLFGERGYGSG